MAEKKIDDKLADLFKALKKLHGLTDRTEAIEDLAQRLATMGEEQLTSAEDRMTHVCNTVIESINKAASVPEKIQEAASFLDNKALVGLEKLEVASSKIDRSVGECAKKVEQAAISLKETATSSGDLIERKIKDAVGKSSLANLIELQQRVESIEKDIIEIKQFQSGIVEAFKAAAQAESAIKSTLDEVKGMVALIPTKRGLFG